MMCAGGHRCAPCLYSGRQAGVVATKRGLIANGVGSCSVLGTEQGRRRAPQSCGAGPCTSSLEMRRSMPTKRPSSCEPVRGSHGARCVRGSFTSRTLVKSIQRTSTEATAASADAPSKTRRREVAMHSCRASQGDRCIASRKATSLARKAARTPAPSELASKNALRASSTCASVRRPLRFGGTSGASGGIARRWERWMPSTRKPQEADVELRSRRCM
mmetsp:Transcript_28159/g.82756  ORF Transcript_28159/g.82756 Transcript_28159/m.82756 type:complete len:217 (+) Transcript_28159:246-896(+)